MWWAIVTLGTVGYGDVVPITPAGRLVAAVTIFAGLIIMALPIGIIATAFAEEVHRRDFVITWTMISRVPLFSALNAGEVGDIMKLLKARRVEAGAVIARRGERAELMFSIADGEVDIAMGGKRCGSVRAISLGVPAGRIQASTPDWPRTLGSAPVHYLP